VDEDGDVRYAVVRDGSRLAWGLRSEEAAARWILRLGGPALIGRPRRGHGGAPVGTGPALHARPEPWWSS
jgi:hypothetical protein